MKFGYLDDAIRDVTVVQKGGVSKASSGASCANVLKRNGSKMYEALLSLCSTSVQRSPSDYL